jgi:glycerophosphoryl diester phosphodiesterase
VAAVRRSDPDIVTGQLFDAGFDFDRDLDRVRAEGHSWVAPIVDDVMTDAAGFMTAAHKAGLRVVVWTVDDAEAIRTLTAAGTDAIITNDPAETLRVLRSSPI